MAECSKGWEHLQHCNWEQVTKLQPGPDLMRTTVPNSHRVPSVPGVTKCTVAEALKYCSKRELPRHPWLLVLTQLRRPQLLLLRRLQLLRVLCQTAATAPQTLLMLQPQSNATGPPISGRREGRI